MKESEKWLFEENNQKNNAFTHLMAQWFQVLDKLCFWVQNNVAYFAFILSLKMFLIPWKMCWLLTTRFIVGSSEGLGRSPSDTSLCFVEPRCWVSCCCELTDNSQTGQYRSFDSSIFSIHSGSGSGRVTFSDAFGLSLLPKIRVIRLHSSLISSYWNWVLNFWLLIKLGKCLLRWG